jgi:tetratricopeptide (TPR) repeat protein
MGITDSTSYRYWAFISYSNKDKSWARWLHRAIETYGIPARLISHPTPAGEPAPKRLQPLFHDRVELPASSDLGTQIEDALRASRYLIVICSPHAAQSKWVNKEIETFRHLDRPGRVLAVIVDGEPNTGDERECFPTSLRQAEPIAADARRSADGKVNAKLKLLAGMLGVGFDALKQRDTQRRIRRLQYAIVLALVLALGFASLALYADRQRDKAVRARREAESIMEDLISSLTDPGPTRSLREYRKYLRISERLASSNPGNVVWQRDMAVSHERVGGALAAQGDLDGAAREFQAGVQIMERLASSDSSNFHWRLDLTTLHRGIGSVLEAKGDLVGALSEYQLCVPINERLSSSAPRNVAYQKDAVYTYLRMAEINEKMGQSDAVVWWRKAYEQLSAMKQRGIMLPTDEQLLAQLKQKVKE